MDQRIRRTVRVEGVVQGVGFRPFVHALATRLGLAGWVGNDSDGVVIDVEGPPYHVEEFLAAIERDAPRLAVVERITATAGEPGERAGFTIAASSSGGRRRTLVAADTATCEDCLRELDDPADRRFGYAFVNCTNCGPRFTIVRDVPYDRELTTMAAFTMCRVCAAEYHDPADRRFHAQPTCCPDCGPRLRLVRDGVEQPGDPIASAAALLRHGEILAVKGLGGYHLAVLAAHEPAAAELRRRKHRAAKPFAVMVSDVDSARRLCQVDEVAAALLAGPRRPVVLLDRTPSAEVAAAVAPGNRQLGLMLPYTPLHRSLLRAAAAPIVLTSGNVSDEPIAFRDDDATARLTGIADAFLTHDRPIHIRTDDSVVRPLFGRGTLVRRSRGHVPEPVPLAPAARRPILACGAELKNTFCLAKGRHAVMSHHIGDLENYETLRSFVEGIAHFRRLFDVDPVLVAHDLHPEYLSTKHAIALRERDPELTLVGVQHHHAHIASCLADNGESGPVLGVALDGLGYGTDGTIWGGEFLVADLISARRAGRLAPVPLPGGTAAIRQPWRLALSYLDAAYGADLPPGLDVVRRNQPRWTDVLAVARAGTNSPLTSSAGRLFDAVAALLGVRDTISYEGQAAIELEQLADPAETGSYPAAIGGGTAGETLVVHGEDLVRAATEDLLAGVGVAKIATRFHNGVVDAVAGACVKLRETTGLTDVALSGGVFQNVLIVTGVAGRLADRGFRVLTHSQVPTNDGGISLGQAAVAAARDRAAADGLT
jgi:hydrogenase maturation protein HypF